MLRQLFNTFVPLKEGAEEEQFKVIFENTNDGIVVLDKFGKIIDANKRTAEIFGGSAEELVGKSFIKLGLFSIKEVTTLLSNFANALTGKKTYMEVSFKNKKGQQVDLECSASLLKIGDSIRIMSIIRDVTKRKNMERELEEYAKSLEKKVHDRTQDLENSQIAIQNVLEDLNIEKSKIDMARAKDEAILASIGDGMITVDEQDSIIAISSRTEKLLGWRFDEIKGKKLYDVIPIANEKGEFIPKEKRPMHIALTTGKTTITAAAAAAAAANTTTYFYVRRDGTRFPVAITVAPVLFNGKIIGAIDNFRDITEEKEIDNAKTEFVSLASHQLKTPATGVKAYLSMLLDEDAGKLNSKQREFVAKSYQGNERELKIIEDLLNVARVETGRLIVEKKETDLSGLVDELVTQYAGAVKLRGQTIKAVKPTKPVKTSVDPEKLWMALGNLIDNASKYTHEGGHIELGLKEDKKKAYISVKDSGIGIAQKDFDKLFKKLSRLDSVMTTSVTGTGLGLYLVKRIVELHNGRISVNSTLGKGSEFMIELPKGVSTNEQSLDN